MVADVFVPAVTEASVAVGVLLFLFEVTAKTTITAIRKTATAEIAIHAFFLSDFCG